MASMVIQLEWNEADFPAGLSLYHIKQLLYTSSYTTKSLLGCVDVTMDYNTAQNVASQIESGIEPIAIEAPPV